MKTVLTLAAVAAATLTVAAPAQAQRYYSINERQQNQFARIQQGVRSGALTRPEAARLRGQFRDLARLENRYRANGLSAGERADLNRRFDRLSQRIYVQKRDRQVRY
jgi:hypothetical protein